MTYPERALVTHFFIEGPEVQIKTSDDRVHVCRSVPRYDMDRLHLHLKQPSEKGKTQSLILVLTLTADTNRFHFTWTAASTLSPTPLMARS